MKVVIIEDDMDVNFVFTYEEIKKFPEITLNHWHAKGREVEISDELYLEFQETYKKFVEINNKLEKFKK